MDSTDMMVMGLTSFKVALVFHIAGALLLFAAIGLQTLVTILLRFARSVSQVRLAAKVARKLPIIFGLSSAAVLLSGLFMGYLDWHYGEEVGWIVVALVMFVLTGIYGAVSGQMFGKKLAHELAASGGQMTNGLTKLCRSSRRAIDTGVSVASVLGILVVMVFQPSVAISILILINALAYGLIFTIVPLSAGKTEPAKVNQDET